MLGAAARIRVWLGVGPTDAREFVALLIARPSELGGMRQAFRGATLATKPTPTNARITGLHGLCSADGYGFEVLKKKEKKRRGEKP